MLAEPRLHGPTGHDDGNHRQHRCRQDDAHQSLHPALFDVTDGEVLIDGVDVRDLDPDLLWSRIGLVPQKATFSRDHRIQPALRQSGCDRRGSVGALDIAQAADFVEESPGS